MIETMMGPDPHIFDCCGIERFPLKKASCNWWLVYRIVFPVVSYLTATRSAAYGKPVSEPVSTQRGLAALH